MSLPLWTLMFRLVTCTDGHPCAESLTMLDFDDEQLCISAGWKAEAAQGYSPYFKQHVAWVCLKRSAPKPAAEPKKK